MKEYTNQELIYCFDVSSDLTTLLNKELDYDVTNPNYLFFHSDVNLNQYVDLDHYKIIFKYTNNDRSTELNVNFDDHSCRKYKVIAKNNNHLNYEVAKFIKKLIENNGCIDVEKKLLINDSDLHNEQLSLFEV